jgi:prepilin-type N-terminal cleavage/methylation domain-containing protein
MTFTHRQTGFTLVEMVTSTVILGVLTLVLVITVINKSRDSNLEVVAKKIKADLQYAQDMAMSHGTGVEFVVDIQNNRYSLKWVGGGFLSSIRGTGNFLVSLNQDRYADVFITSTGLVNGVLTFDTLGSPRTGGTEIQTVRSVALLNSELNVKVTPYTGKVYVE